MENELKIAAVSKSYGPRRQLAFPGKKGVPPAPVKALNNVSLTLTPGVHGLLGPNGAGKSTLINIITGSLNQSSGTVYYNGQSIRALGRRFRQVLGFMPQQQGLYNGFTGYEFLDYLCALKGIPKTETVAEIQRLADAVNLSGELSKKLGAYSGGMKQRILTAGALAGNPQVVIMDEPTAGLDPKERVRLRSMLNALSSDKIILVATHVVSDVESIASSIILLRKGVVAGRGTPGQLVAEHAPGQSLEEVYLHVFGEE